MATKKTSTSQEKSGEAKAGKAKAPARKSAAAASHPLAKELGAHLGISEEAVIVRALEELASSVGLHGKKPHEQPGPKAAAIPEPRTASGSIAPGGYLPRRLYLSLDSRGMPVEVVDVPFTLGSGRRNSMWINSPQVETLHAQIVQTDDGWIFEDIGSEHGTFLNEKRIDSAVIHDGDTFLLAGYLRVKAELR